MMTFTVKESPTGKRIANANDVVDSIRGIGNADQESYWAIGCNQKHKEVFRKCLFLGGMGSVNVDRRILFKRLLKSGSASWIEIHNHPSGEPRPSKADIDNALELEKASGLLGLHMLDSLIIGEDDFFSFAHEGILPGKASNKEGVRKKKKHSSKRKASRNSRSAVADSNPFSERLKKFSALKSEWPDAILFFNMEDAYQTFFEDAKVSSQVLDIPLNTLGPYKGAVLPICEIPIHLGDSSIGKLVHSGWRVAVLTPEVRP